MTAIRFNSSKALIGAIIILLLVLALLLVHLTKGKVLSERHQAFMNSDTFDYDKGSFEDYLAYSQNYLRQARLDSPSDTIIHNASPFMLKPSSNCKSSDAGKYKKGIVLTHGLIASPYSMRPIAEYFQSRCFYVMAVLLPEHASRPGDFLKTSWQAWANVQNFAVRRIQEHADEVFLSGHSMGAELALYEAAQNPNIRGLVLFTPGSKITKAAKYAKYINWLSVFSPKLSWFEIRDDISRYRYESITYSAAQESYGLIKATNKLLEKNKLNIPIFMVASVEDNTVDTNALLSFMSSQSHPASKTLLYSQHPKASSERVKVQLSFAPEQGVLSVSHLGIMSPASHPEYGRDGAYRSCGHYFGQAEKLSLCMDGKRDFYGEVTPENLEKGIIERISFNPFYDELLKEIDEFLQEI